ncbi:hypothetical protein [Embleya scabrispora]|nr:hypothetical protein [Embleya scabrispora]
MMIPYTVVCDGHVLHGAFESDLPGTEYFEGPGQGGRQSRPRRERPVARGHRRVDPGTTETGTDAVYGYRGVTGAQARAWLIANGHHDAAHRHFGTSA